jgi:hypothetical protein
LDFSGEVAVLAQREVVTVCANEASSDDWPHVATNALILIVCCKSVGKNGNFNAFKFMVSTMDAVNFNHISFFGLFLKINFQESGIETLLTDVDIVASFALEPWSANGFTTANIALKILMEDIVVLSVFQLVKLINFFLGNTLLANVKICFGF